MAVFPLSLIFQRFYLQTICVNSQADKVLLILQSFNISYSTSRYFQKNKQFKLDERLRAGLSWVLEV